MAQGRSHWLITVALMVTDVIGSGVLALPATLASLGWIGGLIALLVLGFISLYTGLLIARLRGCHPHVGSYADLGQELLGKKGRALAATLSYVQMFGLCVVFIVGMSIFANQVAESMHFPPPCFVVSAACICAVTLAFAQVRDLHGIGHVSAWIGLPTLYICLALLFGQLFGSEEALFQQRTDMRPPFGASKAAVGFMNIVLTYAGHVVYFELLGSMAQPRDFPKAVWVSQALIMATYFAVAILVYVALGNEVASPFSESLHPSAIVGVADIVMIVHVLFSLLINHHIISRVLYDWSARHLRCCRSAKDPSSGGLSGLGWPAATASILAGAWLVANVVPFFSEVMALLSSVAALNLTYSFPAAAALLQHRRDSIQATCADAGKAESEDGESASNSRAEVDARAAQVFAYPSIEIPLCCTIVFCSAILMVYGVQSAVQDTIQHWASIDRRPFGC
mmetsp:Transcript_62428/g.190913  ORF Transcript_62428/g.190913 Transcript_62428/m.190913 type:complete len:453 (-) Transcript_62428:126-1484(-)